MCCWVINMLLMGGIPDSSVITTLYLNEGCMTGVVMPHEREVAMAGR